MNKQEVFDKVASHLLTQKRLSVNKNNSAICRYKTKKGLKCAIGCLIPDELYDPDIEGRTVNMIISSGEPSEKTLKLKSILYQVLGGTLLLEDYLFLIELQQIHDFIQPSKWKSRLIEFAESHSLQINASELNVETEN